MFLNKIKDFLDPFLFSSLIPMTLKQRFMVLISDQINKYSGKEVKYVCRGGLFGGHKDFLSEANGCYYELLNRSIDEKLMGTEESVFSIMANLYPENYRRYALDGNGLIKFVQAIDDGTAKLEDVNLSTNKKRIIVPTNINQVKTNLYFLTFNYPEQLVHHSIFTKT